MARAVILFLLLASAVFAQDTTEKPVGTFFRLPNGDDATTITPKLPTKTPALKKDAFYKIYKTSETALTTITLLRTDYDSSGTLTTRGLAIPLIRRTTGTLFRWALKPDYFFYNGNLFHRVGP